MDRLKLKATVSRCALQCVKDRRTHIILSQEVEGAEELIVVKLEALSRFHALQILGVRGRLRCDLLDAALGLEMPMRILRGDSRAPAAATVVAVRVVRRMRRDGRVVRDAIVVLVRHDGGGGDEFFVVMIRMMFVMRRCDCAMCVRCVGGAEDGRKLAQTQSTGGGCFRRRWRDDVESSAGQSARLLDASQDV